MECRNQWTGFFLFLFLWLPVAGCGTEEASPDTSPSLPLEEPPSCDTLRPRLLEIPLTGSEFHCFRCSREWNWTTPAHRGNLFVLVSVTCERLRSEAYLEIRDAQETIVWQQEIRSGCSESYCARLGSPPGEALSVHLRGSLDLPFLKDLIEEFRGSVYLKVFDERGLPVAGPDS